MPCISKIKSTHSELFNLYELLGQELRLVEAHIYELEDSKNTLIDIREDPEISEEEVENFEKEMFDELFGSLLDFSSKSNKIQEKTSDLLFKEFGIVDKV